MQSFIIVGKKAERKCTESTVSAHSSRISNFCVPRVKIHLKGCVELLLMYYIQTKHIHHQYRLKSIVLRYALFISQMKKKKKKESNSLPISQGYVVGGYVCIDSHTNPFLAASRIQCIQMAFQVVASSLLVVVSRIHKNNMSYTNTNINTLPSCLML